MRKKKFRYYIINDNLLCTEYISEYSFRIMNIIPGNNVTSKYIARKDINSKIEILGDEMSERLHKFHESITPPIWRKKGSKTYFVKCSSFKSTNEAFKYKGVIYYFGKLYKSLDSLYTIGDKTYLYVQDIKNNNFKYINWKYCCPIIEVKYKFNK